MRKLLCFILFATLACAASGATVKVNLADWRSGVVGRRLVTITPLNTPATGTNTNGTAVALSDVFSTNTPATGVFYMSNVLAGAYTLATAGNPTTTFTFLVTNSVDVLNAWDLRTTAPTTGNETTGYTIAQSSAAFIAKNNGLGTNTSLYGPRLQPGTGTSNMVWSLTNATTGQGEWRQTDAAAMDTNGVNAAGVTNIAMAVILQSNFPALIKAEGALSTNYATSVAAAVSNKLQAVKLDATNSTVYQHLTVNGDLDVTNVLGDAQLFVSSHIDSGGTVTAQAFVGDGSGLTGLPSSGTGSTNQSTVGTNDTFAGGVTVLGPLVASGGAAVSNLSVGTMQFDAAVSGAIVTFNASSNLAPGVPVAKLNTNSIVGGANVTLTTNAGVVTIAATGGGAATVSVTNVYVTTTNAHLLDIGNFQVVRVFLMTNSVLRFTNHTSPFTLARTIIQQDTNGSRLATFEVQGGTLQVPTNTSMTLSTAPNALDILDVAPSLFSTNLAVAWFGVVSTNASSGIDQAASEAATRAILVQSNFLQSLNGSQLTNNVLTLLAGGYSPQSLMVNGDVSITNATEDGSLTVQGATDLQGSVTVGTEIDVRTLIAGGSLRVTNASTFYTLPKFGTTNLATETWASATFQATNANLSLWQTLGTNALSTFALTQAKNELIASNANWIASGDTSVTRTNGTEFIRTNKLTSLGGIDIRQDGSGGVTLSNTVSASAGPAIVTNSIWVGAGAWTPASNAPAAITMTNGFDVVDMFSFDDTVNESICVRWAPPVGFAGLLSPNLHWEAQTWATATAASNIVWELSVVPSITNQTPLGGVIWSTGANVTNRAWSSNVIEVATLPTLTVNSNMQPRAFLSMRLTRHGTNATSKLTGDARFMGMQLSFTQTNWMGGY